MEPADWANRVLTVSVFVVDGRERRICTQSVNMLDPISILRPLASFSLVKYLFKGILLIDSFSFAFYKFKDGDEIYMIKAHMAEKREKITHVPQIAVVIGWDKDEMRWTPPIAQIGSDLINEILRLSDLRRSISENRFKRHGKFKEETQSDISKPQATELQTSMAKSEQISTDALPAFWCRECDAKCQTSSANLGKG